MTDYGILGVATALAWAIAPWGCGADVTPPAADVSRRDSAGVEIVESPSPQWTAETAWRLGSEPRLRIGTFDGPDEQQLFRVTGAVRMDQGRIAIANAGSHEVRFYGPDGAFRSSVGGEGEGPGEFQFLGRIQRLGGDTLRVWDFSARRLSDLSEAEGFLGSRTLESTKGDDSATYLRTMADGSMIAMAMTFPDMESLDDGELLDRDATYWKYDADGGVAAEFGAFSQGTQLVSLEESGGRIVGVTIRTAPLRIGAQLAVLPAGAVVALPDRHELQWFDGEGRLSRSARYAAELQPVTSAHFEQLVSNPRLTPEQQRAERERFEDIALPEFLPTVVRIVADLIGNIWIQHYVLDRSAPRSWTVIDPSGVWMGWVETPARFNPLEIGPDYVLGSWTDELDVEYVLMYDLITEP